jgi:septum formation protein
VDETPHSGESPREYVIRLATAKARVIAAIRPDSAVILGADTTVVVEYEMIGKPIDTDDARRMLRLLSGKWHEVMTGIALITPNETRTDAATTRVKFARLTDAELDWYLASGEPADKAGAYAIQGLASRFIERIEGNYPNVVGLPVETVWRIAAEVGIKFQDLI